MQPWIQGDKQDAAAVWGWARRCCRSGRQEGLVQGERVWLQPRGVGDTHVFTASLQNSQSHLCQHSPQQELPSPVLLFPLEQPPVMVRNSWILQRVMAQHHHSLAASSCFHASWRIPRGLGSFPLSLFWLNRTSKLKSKKGAGQRDSPNPNIHISCFLRKLV